MATTVAQAFAEFASKIAPTNNQWDVVRGRRSAVESYLRTRFGPASNMPLQHVQLIGSAERGTLIRPVDDVDVFAVFDDRQVWPHYQSNSQQLLYRVKDALADYRVETAGARGQAVRLFYTPGPHIDITPAFPWFTVLGVQTGYVIPSGNGSWTQTDPYEHDSFMAFRDEQLDGHLKPLVRMLKRWNREHSSRLGSFHLEVITQAVFQSMNGDMPHAVELFFEYASARLHTPDPAGYGGDLAVVLTPVQEQAVDQSFATARDHVYRARTAQASGNVAEALRQWRIVFGNEFPAYG